jgi:nucleotidyltransferase substrate binding protein (TIGR01987 family)
MEQRDRFRIRLESLIKAVAGFESSLNINLVEYNKEVADVIKNGRIQKFEYSSELTWKTIKDYLYFAHSIDAKSPKQSVKEFYLLDVISFEEYETLLNMLNDRNRLSHIYKEEYFEEIHSKLTGYLAVMKKVEQILKTNN